MNPLQAALQNALSRRERTETRRTLRPFERSLTGNSASGRLIYHAGRSLIDVSSNDYLGLSGHPALRKRASAWADCHGTGARASRLVNGTSPLHLQVEEKLAALKKAEASLLFSSGWQANASILPALSTLSVQETGHKAQFFMDRLNHASLYHGCASADVMPVRFRHNDLAHLENLLKHHQGAEGLIFILTESVFSMDGDRADLPALRHLADRFGAFLYVDEAHATGVLGPEGRGLSCGLADITMSTASKALGGMGAFMTGSRTLCTYMLNHASGFIYSTALPPAVLGALDAALDLLPSLETERQTLHRHARTLRQRLKEAGYDTGPSDTQILPVMIGDSHTALRVAQALENEGFLTIAIRPPTVPPNTARLRLALNSTLTEEDCHTLAGALLRHLPPPSSRPGP